MATTTRQKWKGLFKRIRNIACCITLLLVVMYYFFWTNDSTANDLEEYDTEERVNSRRTRDLDDWYNNISYLILSLKTAIKDRPSDGVLDRAQEEKLQTFLIDLQKTGQEKISPHEVHSVSTSASSETIARKTTSPDPLITLLPSIAAKEPFIVTPTITTDPSTFTPLATAKSALMVTRTVTQSLTVTTSITVIGTETAHPETVTLSPITPLVPVCITTVPIWITHTRTAPPVTLTPTVIPLPVTIHPTVTALPKVITPTMYMNPVQVTPTVTVSQTFYEIPTRTMHPVFITVEPVWVTRTMTAPDVVMLTITSTQTVVRTLPPIIVTPTRTMEAITVTPTKTEPEVVVTPTQLANPIVLTPTLTADAVTITPTSTASPLIITPSFTEQPITIISTVTRTSELIVTPTLTTSPLTVQYTVTLSDTSTVWATETIMANPMTITPTRTLDPVNVTSTITVTHSILLTETVPAVSSAGQFPVGNPVAISSTPTSSIVTRFSKDDLLPASIEKRHHETITSLPITFAHQQQVFGPRGFEEDFRVDTIDTGGAETTTTRTADGPKLGPSQSKFSVGEPFQTSPPPQVVSNITQCPDGSLLDHEFDDCQLIEPKR